MDENFDRGEKIGNLGRGDISVHIGISLLS